MRAAAKTPTAGTSVAILTCLLCAAATSPALGQTDPAGGASGGASGGDAAAALAPVLVNQVQLGDVFASQKIHVVSGDPVVSQAVAAGNTVSSLAEAPGQNYVGAQRVAGAVSAQAGARVEEPAGSLLQAASSATGNSSTAGVCCGALQGLSTQSVDAGGAVSATTHVAGQAQQVSADSTAIGSTQGFETTDAEMLVGAVQHAVGATQARTTARVGDVDTESGYSATAVSQDVTAESDTGVIGLTTQQTADASAPVKASLKVEQDGGDTVLAQSTATSNNLNALSGGVVAVTAQQANAADVDAQAAVALNGWNSASVGAYGVGNSINAESDSGTLLATTQTNTGAVSASASLGGGTGGDSYVNATAVGNALQGFSCGSCSGGVSATAEQTNGGRVSSVGKVNGYGGGSVVGASSAVGNSATFTVRGSN